MDSNYHKSFLNVNNTAKKFKELEHIDFGTHIVIKLLYKYDTIKSFDNLEPKQN